MQRGLFHGPKHTGHHEHGENNYFIDIYHHYKPILLKGASINSFAIGKSSEIDASRGELLSDIRDYEGMDAGETLA